MKYLIILFSMICLGLNGAYQYNIKGNQGWLEFDSKTTLSFQLERSGKDKEHENFIDKGQGVVDYGWYNLKTGETGSFKNGLVATFNENDNIGLYVTDKEGNTYLSTKPQKPFENDLWGKSRIEEGNIIIGGGNFGSNGTHEYYVFKVNNISENKSPSGQPLPGIIATLFVGFLIIFYFRYKRKEHKYSA